MLYVLNNANSHSPIDDHKIAVGPEDEQLFHGNPASQLTKWTTLSHLEVKVCVTSCIDTCMTYKDLPIFSKSSEARKCSYLYTPVYVL